MHVDHPHATIPNVGRGFRQRREMALASDKGKRRPRSRVVPGDHASAAYLSQVREYLRMSRASREIDAQQLRAQLVERRRHVGDQRRQPWRLGIQLRVDDLRRRAGERRPAGDRLEQHHSDSVPVGGRSETLAKCLFGRHVRERAGRQTRPAEARRRRPS